MLTKRMLAATLACLVLGGMAADAAGAKKRQVRQVEDDYATPAAVIEVGAGGVYACANGGSAGNLGCLEFPTKPTERFLELEIFDASGLPAPAWVVQEDSEEGGPVCGKTDGPMKITPGVTAIVWVYPYMLDPLCPGVATAGRVRVVFSNVP